MENKPKIEINPPKPKGGVEWDKTIHRSVEFEHRQIDFFEQKNGNDCGACMLLNMQDALNVKSKADWVTNVKNMREWLSQHNKMRKDYRDDGYGGSWIATGDLQLYINEQLGLQQKIIKNDRYVAPQSGRHDMTIHRHNNKVSFTQEILPEELFQDKRNKFIWGIYSGTRNEHGDGNHYTGYLQTSSGIYLFDSKDHQSFQVKTRADLDDFIQHNIGYINVVFGPSPKIITRENNNERVEANQPVSQNSTPEQSNSQIEIKNRTDSRARRMMNAIRKILR